MKRLLSLLIIPFVALMLVACDKNKTHEDVKNLYQEMQEAHVYEENNLFFSSDENPNTITIYYSSDILDAINNPNPVNDIQKRYVALGLQQKILNFAFNYYEKHQSDFYREISSVNYDKSDMNNLYNSLNHLNNTLTGFSAQYESFVGGANLGISDIMMFSMTSYSFELNKVIEASFDFIDTFGQVFEKYCVQGDVKSPANISVAIDASYVQLANVVYYENFKAFNYAVGSNGKCDLQAIVSTLNEYNLTNYIKQNIGTLSLDIVNDLASDGEQKVIALAKVDDFLYAKEVFEQRIAVYENIYRQLDIYVISEYKFNLVPTVSYDTFKSTLIESNKANVESLENFVKINFIDYLTKLYAII